MITSLELQDFRGYESLRLDNLGPINLVVGPNGSGKTSLLQAAFVLCVRADPGKVLSLFPPETDNASAEEIAQAFNWAFRKHLDSFALRGMIDGVERESVLGRSGSGHSSGLSRPKSTSSSGSRGSSPRELGPATNLAAIRESADYVYEMKTTHDGETDTGRLYVGQSGIYNDAPTLAPRVKSTFTRATRGQRIPELPALWDSATSSGTSEEIEELARRVEPNLESIRIGVSDEGAPVLRAQHRVLGACPLSVLGQGLVDAIHFSLRVRASAFDVANFDEFDASLHVSVLRILAAHAKAVSQTTQLFLTTHRSDTVGAFVDLLSDGWDGLRIIQTRAQEGRLFASVIGPNDVQELWQGLALDIRSPS